MTVSPDVPPLAVDSLLEAEQALRRSGLRLSTPRRLVLEALFAADGPVAASDLAQQLSIDESSVYRNLEVLEHRGLIRHVHLGHSGLRDRWDVRLHLGDRAVRLALRPNRGALGTVGRVGN